MFMILLPVPKRQHDPFWCTAPFRRKKEDASISSRVFLEKIGEAAEALDSCKFCHSEKADVEVEKQIKSDGHHIVPLDGCPDN